MLQTPAIRLLDKITTQVAWSRKPWTLRTRESIQFGNDHRKAKAATLRVLFLTYDYPFPSKYGGHMYTGNLAIGMAATVDRFLALTFQEGAAGRFETKIESSEWVCHPKPPRSRFQQVFSRYPSVAVDYRSKAYRQEFLNSLKSLAPDVIIFDHIAGIWLFDDAKAYRDSCGPEAKPLLVYVSHNVDTDLKRQIAANYTGNFLMKKFVRQSAEKAARAEEELVNQCDITTAETTEDCERFSELYKPRMIIKVAPGYDGHYIEQRTIDDATPNNVAIIGGRLSLMKRLVLDKLLSEAAAGIQAQGYAAHVAGPISDEYRQQCASKYPQCTFHGFLENVDDVLGDARFGIIADHVGGGFKHRILTYVFHRVPIIAEPVAMAGVPLEAGKHYIAVNNYGEIPAALERYGRDTATLQEMQTQAYDVCREEFSWDRTSLQFCETLREVLAERRSQ